MSPPVSELSLNSVDSSTWAPVTVSGRQVDPQDGAVGDLVRVHGAVGEPVVGHRAKDELPGADRLVADVGDSHLAVDDLRAADSVRRQLGCGDVGSGNVGAHDLAGADIRRLHLAVDDVGAR